MTELETGINIVENAIKKMNIDPVACRGDKTGQYNMVQGSISIWIDVWHNEREQCAYFQVMSPILDILKVENKSALYEELLTINDGLYNVSFTIYNNFVWLKTTREVQGLDESEVMAQIRRVGNYGDRYDDVLKQKYNPTSPTSTNVAGSQPQ
ncbi:MAG: YbjN domain-containing protein [Chitinophagales bacterium]